MSIDFEKFSKYSKAGPRYTSYPTAVEFSEQYDYVNYIDSLKSQNSERPLSIYLHIPFCRSACYFCGCNVVYTSKEEKKVRYIEYLKKELDILKNTINTSRSVVQFHIGGGTPTFLSPAQLDEVMGYIREVFTNFDSDAEVACEIDPRFFELGHMEVLQKWGFNRLSFGVQDFDDDVQVAIHRVQSPKLIEDSTKVARAHGITSINFDLIYGLPNQNFDTFANTLNIVSALEPERIAVFNYAHVPWMKKTMRKIDETTLPEPSEKLKILKYTIGFLKEKGYKMIGMDHFAKESDELFKAIEKNELRRSFQGYTTKGGSDTIGIGLTSIGESDDYYAQNYKDLENYEHAIDAGRLPHFRGIKLTEEDVLRKEIIMSLMSNFKLDIKKIDAKFGINFNEKFADALKELDEFVQDGLVEISEDFIQVSDTGAMLIRNIVMPFDAYLQKIPTDQRKFSKTV